MTIVLDASITMAWCFEDEASTETGAVLQRLRDEPAAVPALWPLEVANMLVVAQRRERMTEAQAARFVDLLRRLPIHVDHGTVDIGSLVLSGRRHDLTAYDAWYLLLAERLGAPLATLDQSLAAAARDAGVELVIDPA